MHGSSRRAIKVNYEEFEKKVMDKLLNYDSDMFKNLKVQYEKSEVISQEITGCGFFTTFNVPKELAYMGIKGRIDDVKGDIINVEDEYLFFILYIENGKIDTLECFSTLDNWDYNYDNVEVNYCYEHERNFEIE